MLTCSSGSDSDDESADDARIRSTNSGPAEQRKALESAVSLAERYFDRVDPPSFLQLVPPSAPLSVLGKYLTTVIEFGNMRKKNLQVRVTVEERRMP